MHIIGARAEPALGHIYHLQNLLIDEEQDELDELERIDMLDEPYRNRSEEADEIINLDLSDSSLLNVIDAL